MRQLLKSFLYRLSPAIAISSLAVAALAETQHGIAMYGNPVLPADYQSLPYANPRRPIGRDNYLW